MNTTTKQLLLAVLGAACVMTIGVGCSDDSGADATTTSTGGAAGATNTGGDSASATGGSAGATGGSSTAAGGSGTGGSTAQPTAEEQAFLGAWTQVSHSTDGTTCPINPDSGSDDMDGAVATGDGHIIVGAGSSCPLTLAVTGQVAQLAPGFECPSGESKLVYDEYKWELTGETTSRITMKATLVAGSYSCAMHSVIEAKR